MDFLQSSYESMIYPKYFRYVKKNATAASCYNLSFHGQFSNLQKEICTKFVWGKAPATRLCIQLVRCSRIFVHSSSRPSDDNRRAKWNAKAKTPQWNLSDNCQVWDTLCYLIVSIQFYSKLWGNLPGSR